jgi:AcrR family transcriptional regulator
MSKTLQRREKLRDALILAAERSLAAKGLSGLSTRDLAREIGCANGAIYNLVEDLDDLILRVGSKTLARLDAALSAAETGAPASPRDRLVVIAIAYCDFAADNIELWRALFEHRMAPDKAVPDWAIEQQTYLFRHIHQPLATLFPNWSATELSLTARGLFSSVHGMVALGLEQKLVAVPIDALRNQIAIIIRAVIDGLAMEK